MSSSSFSSSEDLDPSIQPTPDPTLERLVSASSSGNLPSVEATFEEWKSSQDPVARASSQAPNYAMQPALEAAALKSHLDIVAYFLAEGFHITEEVVRNAIRAPSIAALELFLDHGWHINRRRPRCRQPAISSAIRLNDLPLVTWFLTHGASPNVRLSANSSCTPLTIAVANASLPIVNLLIAYGGRIDHGNLLSALCASSVPGRLAILGELIARGAPINELRDSQNPGRYIVTSRLGAGTPLHSAVEHVRVAIAAALLAHGANKGIVDTKGRTPLGLARELGKGRMVEPLEEG